MYRSIAADVMRTLIRTCGLVSAGGLVRHQRSCRLPAGEAGREPDRRISAAGSDSYLLCFVRRDWPGQRAQVRPPLQATEHHHHHHHRPVAARIVAQRWEAGGHVWGTVATMPLVPAVVDAVAPVPTDSRGRDRSAPVPQPAQGNRRGRKQSEVSRTIRRPGAAFPKLAGNEGWERCASCGHTIRLRLDDSSGATTSTVQYAPVPGRLPPSR
jgi:hypothetical protein